MTIVVARILVRNKLEKQFRRGIPRKTSEMTCGIVFEAAARRIGRLVVDLRQLQRQGVHEDRVAATVLHHYRSITHGRIEIMAIEGTRRLPVVVQEPEHPLPRRGL